MRGHNFEGWKTGVMLTLDNADVRPFIGCVSVSVVGFSSKISALCTRLTWLHGFGQIFYLNEFNIVKYDIKRLGFNFIFRRVCDACVWFL